MIYIAVQPSSGPDLRSQRLNTINRYFEAIQSSDYAALRESLTPDAVTRWPQSGERMTGALSCVRVHENYPGGPPSSRIERISGDGDVWIAELVTDYGSERWHTISVIEFAGLRIARLTEYFGSGMAAPEWRKELVEREDSRS